MAELQKEAIQKSVESKPKVWKTKFDVGDAVEIEHVEEGGVNNQKTEKIRGVVLGIFRKGIDHTILIRDILFGHALETTVPLHSPMVKSLKVLEKRFVTKGKKRVRKAKLYYLSERNPLGTCSFVVGANPNKSNLSYFRITGYKVEVNDVGETLQIASSALDSL